MPRRTSIYVDGVSHKNPIPAAARIGPFVFSGLISGAGEGAHDLDAQCERMFANVRQVMEAAGGGMDDIVKLAVAMADRDQRPVLNRTWLKVFPDPASRPARHTVEAALDPGVLIQCEFVAVIGG